MVHVIFSSSKQQLMACWRQKTMLAHTEKKPNQAKKTNKQKTQKQSQQQNPGHFQSTLKVLEIRKALLLLMKNRLDFHVVFFHGSQLEVKNTRSVNQLIN